MDFDRLDDNGIDLEDQDRKKEKEASFESRVNKEEYQRNDEGQGFDQEIETCFFPQIFKIFLDKRRFKELKVRGLRERSC